MGTHGQDDSAAQNITDGQDNAEGQDSTQDTSEILVIADANQAEEADQDQEQLAHPEGHKQ
jgi:hypothetical protein